MVVYFLLNQLFKYMNELFRKLKLAGNNLRLGSKPTQRVEFELVTASFNFSK